MGCDIHAHMEIKVDGEWIHYSMPTIRRNYALFELMAGVRGVLANAVSPPKGIPNDTSKTVNLDNEYWGSDGHSHSWLGAKEIKQIHGHHEKQYGKNFYKVDHEEWGYLYGNGWDGWIEYPESYPKWVEDIRMIFWFDN